MVRVADSKETVFGFGFSVFAGQAKGSAFFINNGEAGAVPAALQPEQPCHGTAKAHPKPAPGPLGTTGMDRHRWR